MNIKKIIVDEKPKFCGDCPFCCQYYDDVLEHLYIHCVATGKMIDDCEERPITEDCDIFEEQSE